MQRAHPCRLARRRRAGLAGSEVSTLVVAVSLATLACATTQAGRITGPLPPSVEAGLELYEQGEYERAGARFREAVAVAEARGDRELELRATTAECTAWLAARRLAELAECGERLERQARRERRSDPGVNTLVAMAAIAGERPLPSLRTPAEVRSVLRQAVREEE
jgi:hypothetical protein